MCMLEVLCQQENYMMFSFCRIQPVYVIDVAAAIVNSLKDDGTSMGKIYELGGPEIYTVHELVTVTPTLLVAMNRF